MPHDDQMRETLHELDPYCAVGLTRLSLRKAVLTRKVPELHPDYQSDGIENHTLLCRKHQGQKQGMALKEFREWLAANPRRAILCG